MRRIKERKPPPPSSPGGERYTKALVHTRERDREERIGKEWGKEERTPAHTWHVRERVAEFLERLALSRLESTLRTRGMGGYHS